MPYGIGFSKSKVDEFRAHLLQTTRSIDSDRFILEQLISSSQSYPSTPLR
jgi:hypothetical protein